jgi:hypothetical protein
MSGARRRRKAQAHLAWRRHGGADGHRREVQVHSYVDLCRHLHVPGLEWSEDPRFVETQNGPETLHRDADTCTWADIERAAILCGRANSDSIQRTPTLLPSKKSDYLDRFNHAAATMQPNTYGIQYTAHKQ